MTHAITTSSIATSSMRRRTLLAGAAAALGTAALPLHAQGTTKIIFGYTAVTDFATLFIAKEEGYFTQRGLDVEPKFIPLNPSIPAAVQSESLQMGGPTPSVFLQSVDGGLDHVVICGGGLTDRSMTGVGFVARAGSGIKTAQDCVGKKIGVPGLGAYLHVGFRAWLKQNGVDYTKVNFIEAAFPQHGDLLRGGSVDAVVTADPFMARILASGVGYVASYYSTFLADGMPTILYTARRDWAQKNAAAVKSFREAIADAAVFLKNPKNKERVQAHVGKFIKLPPEVLAAMQISPPAPVINEKQLSYWVGLMKEQNMLKTPLNVATLIAK
jgi:NitT/TauT family transport system substrate-binding protein